MNTDYFSKLIAKEMKIRKELGVVPGVGSQGNILFACEMKDLGVFICLKKLVVENMNGKIADGTWSKYES